MRTLAAIGCGVVIGVTGFAGWLLWYFRDVMR